MTPGTTAAAQMGGDRGNHVSAAQTAPAAPDLSWLQGLPEGVSYAALTVIGLGMILFYLGPVLRARFMPKAAADKAPAASLTPPALGPAIDQAERLAERHISFLENQLDARDRIIETRERRIAELERELDYFRRPRGG